MDKILVSVAGYDPTAGAGVLLDLKVFQKLGFTGMGILSSATTQNSRKFKSVLCLPPHFIKEQYQLLQEDFNIAGIKIGMLGCKKNIPPVEEILAENQDIPRVIDPVLKSTSGKWTLEKKAIPDFIQKISTKASLITPNCEEARLITGGKCINLTSSSETAKEIYSMTKIPCLLTGIICDDKIVNVVYDGRDIYQIDTKKLSKKVHGSGCLLSSSILSFLAQGYPLFESCQLGSEFTHEAILNSVSLGQGQDIFVL